MLHKVKSIRPFIGAKNFHLSRSFYRDLGFEESIVADNMSYFKTEGFGFYLQDYYAKEWVENSMVFLEVDDVTRHHEELSALKLPVKYVHVRQSQIVINAWGKEYFLHDPAGILWHFGEFF